jgi:hypothetical protein
LTDYESKEEQRLPVPGLLHGSDWRPTWAQDAEKVTTGWHPVQHLFRLQSVQTVGGWGHRCNFFADPMPVDGSRPPRGTEDGENYVREARGKSKAARVYALINELTTQYGTESIRVSPVSADDFATDEKIKTDEEGN